MCNEYGRHTRIWNSDFGFFEKIFSKYFLTSRSRTQILFYFSDFDISKSEIIKIIFLTSIFLSQKNKKKYEFDFAKSEKYFLIWVRLHQVEEIFFYIFLISPNRTRSQNSNYEFEKNDWLIKKSPKSIQIQVYKIPLEFNPYWLGRRKRHRSVPQTFSDRNNLNHVLFMQFDSMDVKTKVHKS